MTGRLRFVPLAAALALVLLAGCGAPPDEMYSPPVEAEEPSGVSPVETEVPAPALPQPAPALKERRLLSVDYPQAVRVGESDRILLVLEVDERGDITPTVVSEGHAVEAQPVEVPDLYDTHRLVVEARLDLAGVAVEPQGSVSETLSRGQAVRLAWSISPAQPGVYRGTLWVYLNLTPREGGETEKQTLMAMPVDIEGRSSILGLPVGAVRWTGALGSVVGFVTGFPFLENILAFIYRKATGKSDKNTNI